MGNDFAPKILLLDDMPAMRIILRNMLEEGGFHRIVDSEDAETGWKLLQNSASDPKEGFSLIISDWHLPGASGIELLRSIRSFPATRAIPFLMVTSQGGESAISEAMRAGVTDYLLKPFTSEQLLEKVRVLI